jgi:hypothetical protein
MSGVRRPPETERGHVVAALDAPMSLDRFGLP